MPSPFPGMDPYLEGTRWPGFYHDLATEVKRQLLPKIQPRYFADTSTFFLLDSEDEVEIGEIIYPDVSVVPHFARMVFWGDFVRFAAASIVERLATKGESAYVSKDPKVLFGGLSHDYLLPGD